MNIEVPQTEFTPIVNALGYEPLPVTNPLIKRYLTSEEQVFAVCNQRTYLGLYPIKPDVIVITNRRILFISPTLLGCSFADVLWLDVADIHMEDKLFSSTLAVKFVNNTVVYMNGLKKDEIEGLYRIGQELQEQVREFRRIRRMQEAQAAAARIKV